MLAALLEVVRAEEADVRAEQQDPDDPDGYWDPVFVAEIEGERRRLESFLGHAEGDS